MPGKQSLKSNHMKIVKVTYTTSPAYARQNEENIRKVMDDLRAASHPGIFYHACLCPDGKTFIHTAFFKAEDDEKVLFALASFKSFQEQLKSSSPEVPPRQELLSLVGSSEAVF